MKSCWMSIEVFVAFIDTIWIIENWQNISKKALANRLTKNEGTITNTQVNLIPFLLLKI